MEKTSTAIILSHYKEREGNLKRIIDDLLSGTVVPKEVLLFIDNPSINYEDKRATVIRSNKDFLPRIRFALGSYFDTDYCFFIDDDLTVRSRTLENFMNYADETSILGMWGSILGNTQTPYANDTPIRPKLYPKPVEVDIILRTYFVPALSMTAGLTLQHIHRELPRESLDDVYLSIGNKIEGNHNYVIPVDNETSVVDIGECGVGQSYRGIHYENRNKVCRFLKDVYTL